MPRGFTDQEMDIIREKLMQAGQDCLEKFGIRKTNVEDLTRAAGISKGAFYKFYDSKEALFLEVLERFEETYRVEIIKRMDQYTGLSPREQVHSLLRDAFTQYWQNPLFSILNPQEYEVLVRKLPPERVAAHLESDDDFVGELVNLWQARGLPVRDDAPQISALVKSLFYVSLHAEEIGSAFPAAFETLINLVADYLVEN